MSNSGEMNSLGYQTMATITFLGAAGTVTGSKYLIKGKRATILVDAGIFQGSRELRERNWTPPPFSVDAVDAVVLTHAHIDHTGLLPRLGAQGLTCPIIGTAPTIELAQLLLLDSGRLNEEEASFRAEKVGSRHQTPRSLRRYRLVRHIPFDTWPQSLRPRTALQHHPTNSTR